MFFAAAAKRLREKKSVDGENQWWKKNISIESMPCVNEHVRSSKHERCEYCIITKISIHLFVGHGRGVLHELDWPSYIFK